MNIKDKQLWLSQFYSATDLAQLNEEGIDKLHAAVQPKKVTIESLRGVDVSSYRVNSLDGFVKVKEWRDKGQKSCVELITHSGTRITASVDHFFEMESGRWKYAGTIQAGEKVKTQQGTEVVTSVINVGIHGVFDFHIDHYQHRYLTNGISSHNSGSGKSLVMMNIALSWIQSGLSGVYITLELSEELTSLRTDAMLTSMSTKEIRRDIDTTTLKVKMVGKKSGRYRVKALPAQSNVNDIRSYLKEVQIQTGIKVDFIMVDYLDLLMPVSAKVSPNDLFVKDKYVSEELRNLAKELNILLITASQLNRCLTLDTIVEVNGAPVRIDTLKVGDYLTSNEGPVRVTEVLPVTKQPVFEITLKSGKKIKCSANHKFPTIGGLKTIGTGLKVGDKLQVLSRRNK